MLRTDQTLSFYRLLIKWLINLILNIWRSLFEFMKIDCLTNRPIANGQSISCFYFLKSNSIYFVRSVGLFIFSNLKHWHLTILFGFEYCLSNSSMYIVLNVQNYSNHVLEYTRLEIFWLGQTWNSKLFL